MNHVIACIGSINNKKKQTSRRQVTCTNIDTLLSPQVGSVSATMMVTFHNRLLWNNRILYTVRQYYCLKLYCRYLPCK